MEIKHENYDPRWFYSYVFLLILMLIILIAFLVTKNDFGPNEIGFSFILILLNGFYVFLSYNEYNARFDKINLTKSSVVFQNSPKFIATGWLTQSGEIKYSDIQSIQVMQIKSGLDIIDEKLNKEKKVNEFFDSPILIKLQLKNGNVTTIGERLPPKKVFQVAVLLEAWAELGNIYSSFKEKFPNLGSIIEGTVDKVKKFMNQKD